MTKQAGMFPLLAGAGAIGAVAGGRAGRHGSDKTNNTPATVLGALGGGTGTIAGAAAAMRGTAPIDDGLNSLNRIKFDMGSTDFSLNRLKGKSDLMQYQLDELNDLMKKRRELKKSLVRLPKWIHALNKRPGLKTAIELGTFGLGATAGGALGAKLGIMGGDALA